MVSPKVQAKLALQMEIRSRCEMREANFKNKAFKKQAKISKKNFKKPVTAINFQNHTPVEGSNKREIIVSKSFQNNLLRSEKQVRSLS